MSTKRESAIARRSPHPAHDLPSRDEALATAQSPSVPAVTAQPSVMPPADPTTEKLTATHNTRVRPTTKTRTDAAVPRHQITTGDKSVSLSSITDLALTEWLDRNNY